MDKRKNFLRIISIVLIIVSLILFIVGFITSSKVTTDDGITIEAVLPVHALELL